LGWQVLDGRRRAAGAASRLEQAGPWRAVEVPPQIRALTAWEADIVAMPGREDALTDLVGAMALVTAGTFVLHLGLLAHPPHSARQAAGSLETAILRAADEVGGFPTDLRLRDPEIARWMELALRRWKVRCHHQADLLGIDTVVASTLRSLDGGRPAN
jgi:hypothetical protein